MAAPPSHPTPPRRQIQVFLTSTGLLPFMSVRKAAGLAIAQLGIGAFFVSGVTWSSVGTSAGWYALAAVLLAALVRAVDVEGWALLIPGGFVRRVGKAFGPRAERVALAATLVERALLTAVACVVIAHYAGGLTAELAAQWRVARGVGPEDLASLLAVALVGLIWLRARSGRELSHDRMARGVWIGVAILSVVIIWAVASMTRDGWRTVLSFSPGFQRPQSLTSFMDVLAKIAVGLALALPMIGSSDTLARAAHEFPPPRLDSLKRTAQLTVLFALAMTGLGTFLVAGLLPLNEQNIWINAPLAGLAQHLAAPGWLHRVMALAVAGAALLILFPAAHIAFTDFDRTLERWSGRSAQPSRISGLLASVNRHTRSTDLAAATIALIVVWSEGRVAWLGRAYAIAIAVMLVLAIAALLHFRKTNAGKQAFKTALNITIAGRELPLGLWLTFAVAGGAAAVLLMTGDVPSIASLALVAGVAAWSSVVERDPEPAAAVADEAVLDLLPEADLSLDGLEARPGNVLVAVRNPLALEHVAAALRSAGDRDVVVMTVRLTDDAGEATEGEQAATRYERSLLSDVVAVAERQGRAIKLVIVPARSVPEAIIATVLRLKSSDIYVGESSTLSADDQARLLGDAWERTPKPEARDVRLVIYHRSGRTGTYHLGAHPPSLTAADLDLIHRVWLDAVKTLGPHVHHHDVVRAALTQMEQQLTGTQRDEALAAIRAVAKPAEELSDALRARDYGRVRDMMRNRHAGEVAALLANLNIEDQVFVFRILPRRDAAAVFEYLDLDAQEALLKAMAQDDVAALLNEMAPDDRTMFLEELPAAATRQLLSLLTPDQRAVAMSLLGYPEQSIGRLMTPDYVAVREQWTVREVLDYIRTHGQDSETLNVIYIVDEQGTLVDDVRIRELLLARLDAPIAELMDRRFVTLKATDDQDAAVALFRKYDRSALPVTDTVGMLIGIVTIDDVLDVVEATTTRDIQKIGGSEALDEPYMDVSFVRMIQKRAGWLTALFLGEMLTATAMGAFEGEIAKAVVLALFVPLIISSGGNSGSQASTLVIRALALGEVGVKDWWRVMRRELLTGLALGAILGVIGFLRITVWAAFSDIYGPHWLLIASTVSISLVGVVLWGTLSGSLLPLVLRRLGFDPATSSAPFVATLVDVTGLMIYFSVAVLLLRGTLL